MSTAIRQRVRSLPPPAILTIKVALLVMGLLLLPAALSAQAPGTEDLRKQARVFERRHDWLEACRVYDEILRRDHGRDDVRQAYQLCLRRYLIGRRHSDRAYREALGRLTYQEALDMYEQVLRRVSKAYLDPAKADLTALFRQGLEEVRMALEEDVFRREYLPGVAREAIEAFKVKLNDWRDRKIHSPSDARAQAFAIARSTREVGIAPRPAFVVVIALEFASGACNGLDEYTFFLTPNSSGDLQAGKMVSVGVEVGMVGGELAILRVYPRSPAQQQGLLPNDLIVRIGEESVAGLLPEEAAKKLRTEPNKTIKLEVRSMGQTETRKVTVVCRPWVAPTVEVETFTMMYSGSDGIVTGVQGGKVKILSFQETTLQEVKEALAVLQTDGMKVLILDLRGNPGGLFQSAVDVTRLFLPDGLIVLTQSRAAKKYNQPFRAGSTNPLLVPMVVLIDSDTASAAEVVAGALKANGRATLVGQTTFGKCSIQCIIPLEKPPFDKMPAGIRLTVARFYWPDRHVSGGQGIEPDAHSLSEDPVETAKRLLQDMLKPMAGTPMTMAPIMIPN